MHTPIQMLMFGGASGKYCVVRFDVALCHAGCRTFYHAFFALVIMIFDDCPDARLPRRLLCGVYTLLYASYTMYTLYTGTYIQAIQATYKLYYIYKLLYEGILRIQAIYKLLYASPYIQAILRTQATYQRSSDASYKGSIRTSFANTNTLNISHHGHGQLAMKRVRPRTRTRTSPTFRVTDTDIASTSSLCP